MISRANKGKKKAAACGVEPEVRRTSGSEPDTGEGAVARESALQDVEGKVRDLLAENEAEVSTEKLTGSRLRSVIEALLFASPDPIPRRRIYRLIPEADNGDIRDALLDLEAELLTTPRGFFFNEDSSGLRLLTKQEYAPYVARLRGERRRIRLSPAAFETLAVVAYRQPVRRADLEAVRGVQCGAVLKNLAEWNLVKVVGQDPGIGRPNLYGTTGEFLDILGLTGLDQLPEPQRLAERGRDQGIEILDEMLAGTDASEDVAEGEGDPE